MSQFFFFFFFFRAGRGGAGGLPDAEVLPRDGHGDGDR
jgi:hypothetical protein